MNFHSSACAGIFNLIIAHVVISLSFIKNINVQSYHEWPYEPDSAIRDLVVQIFHRELRTWPLGYR